MIRLAILAMFAIGFASEANSADPPAAPAAAPSTLGPQELVENSAKRMLVELDANRRVLSFAAAQLRLGLGRFHGRSLRDTAVQGRPQ